MAYALSAFVDSSSQLIPPLQRKVSKGRKVSNGRPITGRYPTSSRRGSNTSLPPIENQPPPLSQAIPAGHRDGSSTNPITRPLVPQQRLPPLAPSKPQATQLRQSRGSSTVDDDNDTKWMISNMMEMAIQEDWEPEEGDDYPSSLTPDPEVFEEFKAFENGIAVLTEDQKRRGTYRPRYCWCNRCQLMYAMHKDDDPCLDFWGNYPCHQW